MNGAWWCHPKRKVVTDAELVLIEYYTFCELCWLSSAWQVVWGKTKRMICNHFEDISLWNNAFRLFTKDKSFFFFFSFWFSKVLFYADFYKPKYQYKMTWCKVLAHWVRRFHIVFFVFFIFVILSYQNACYGCENAENWKWSDFFYDEWKFRRQCVNVIDTT